MATLKQTRRELGLRQSDVPVKIQKSAPDISNYESGAAMPELEDMIVMERNVFEQRIEWNDPITAKQKNQILKALVSLAGNYPLSAIFNFAQRALWDGTKLKDPTKYFTHYAVVSRVIDEPLYNSDIKQDE